MNFLLLVFTFEYSILLRRGKEKGAGMGIGRIVPGGRRNRGEGIQQRRKVRKAGNTTIIDRTCVCFLSVRERSERKGPQQSPERKKEKKGVSNHPHTKPFFLYYAKHPFSIPQGGEDRSPHPPDHLSNDHEQGADRQQAARANGESSAGGRQ